MIIEILHLCNRIPISWKLKAMRKTIILIGGKARSGKDTAASRLISYLPSSAKYAFATLLKDYSRADFGPMAQQITELVQKFSAEASMLEFKTKRDQKAFRLGLDNLEKELCTTDISQWYDEKNLITRNILQLYGTEVVRKRMNEENYWIDKVIESIKKSNKTYHIITDWRFRNELLRIKKVLGDSWSIFGDKYRIITCKIESNRETISQSEHSSEKDINEVKPDCIIANNGTLSDLEKNIEQFIVWLNA
jgi:hypothetical protein